MMKARIFIILQKILELLSGLGQTSGTRHLNSLNKCLKTGSLPMSSLKLRKRVGKKEQMLIIFVKITKISSCPNSRIKGCWKQR